MTRSYSIWVLRKKSNQHLLGAWTVKKEMVTYIKRKLTCEWEWETGIDRKTLEKDYQVLRFRDGSDMPAQLIPWEEIP